MADLIDAATFRDRLGALCVRSRPQLPRNARDRAILLKSALLTLNPDTVYSEHEINLALQDWKRRVASQLGLDHVNLRRALVDDGYLARTADGSAYTVIPEPPHARVRFAAEVAQLSGAAIVRERRERIARERAAHLARREAGRGQPDAPQRPQEPPHNEAPPEAGL